MRTKTSVGAGGSSVMRSTDTGAPTSRNRAARMSMNDGEPGSQNEAIGDRMAAARIAVGGLDRAIRPPAKMATYCN
jgi:hypothetical protein